MENSLIEIRDRLSTVMGYISKIIGDKTMPVIINDEKALVQVQDNIGSLKDLRNIVIDYYKPLKEAARKPYQEKIEEEKVWLESIERVFNFANERVKEFNDRKRAEIQAKERAEAEERARIERERLETEKKEAEAAGNTELAKQIEEAKETTVAGYIPERKMVSRAEMNTMSESETIEDFQILNHEQFAAALLASGKGSMITLDRKTITAFSKYLLQSKDIKEFPGVIFRRDYKTNYKKRSS